MTPDSAAAMPYRVTALEHRVDAHKAELHAINDRTITHETKIEAIEAFGTRIEAKMDRIIWSIVGCAFTIAAAAIGLAMTLGTG